MEIPPNIMGGAGDCEVLVFEGAAWAPNIIGGAGDCEVLVAGGG